MAADDDAVVIDGVGAAVSVRRVHKLRDQDLIRQLPGGGLRKALRDGVLEADQGAVAVASHDFAPDHAGT